jgi:biopolymer transport protein ExbB
VSSNLIVDLTLLLLMLLSIATWSIAAIKFRAFRTDDRNARGFLERFWAERSWTQRAQAAKDGQGDFAQLAQIGYATCQEISGEEGQGSDPQEQQEVLERQLRKALQAMNRRRERGLAELASIGSTAPFIGLFGTVWGIMNALKTITATGSASIDVVAGPIGEALIATAIGIATAIPAVLAYNYFLRHQRVHVTDLDGFLDDFLRHAMRNRKYWGESC